MYKPHDRKNSQKVPILSGKEINDIAEQYVIDYSPEVLKHPKAVNIENFLESYLDLQLDFKFLSHDCRFLGMTVFNDTDKVIIYSPELGEADYIHADHGTVIIDPNLLKDHQEHRYRFTLGHEVGHWIFHRDYHDYDPNQLTMFNLCDQYIQCREINTNYHGSITKNWDEQKWMEWQADKFSAAILMPETAVKNIMDSNKTFTSPLEAYPAIKKLTQVFNVSEQAAYLRLYDLKIIMLPVTDDEYRQLSFL